MTFFMHLSTFYDALTSDEGQEEEEEEKGLLGMSKLRLDDGPVGVDVGVGIGGYHGGGASLPGNGFGPRSRREPWTISEISVPVA